MADDVAELVGKCRGIPSSPLTVLRTDMSALGVSSTSGLMFLGRSCVLVTRMAPLDDTKMRRSNLRRQDAYTPYSDPRGFIYENKDKKNRLMRIDELHKFSDGTLDDVRTALNDRLKGIRMEYLPQTFWSQRDKANARAMIQAIDKRLKTRRIMRSLERFVGGRPYGGDLRLLQRTI
ncbi:hypothetical protein Tco_1044726 [Tanacetum coccineum]|uniref:Uncharacterized protein n=1 Tax=Tanacetum coccineum TaxID=301880 RepID=A0ABQ5GQQ6_9ASTR